MKTKTTTTSKIGIKAKILIATLLILLGGGLAWTITPTSQRDYLISKLGYDSKDQDYNKTQSLEKEISEKLERKRKENMFLVKYKKDVPISEISNINSKNGIKDPFPTEQMPEWIMKNGYLQPVMLENEDNIKELMVNYALDSRVEFVDINGIGELTWHDSGDRTYPNDFESFPHSYEEGKHWYYYKTKLPQVWQDQGCRRLEEDCGGSSDVVVAVLDSGVAFENYDTGNYEYAGLNFNNSFRVAPELDGINLWTNESESGTGPGDNDHNLICDDVHGVDFSMWLENLYSGDRVADPDCSTADMRKEGHPNDDVSHGTYVTGIIASRTNNSSSSVGSAHNVKIMPLKIDEPSNRIIMDEVMDLEVPIHVHFVYHAVLYAVHHGADIINFSSTFSEDYDVLRIAANYAEENNVLFVAARGNSAGAFTRYPVAYRNVVAVGSVNYDNSKSDYSSYGDDLDIVAPVGEGESRREATWQQSINCRMSTLSAICDDLSDFSTQYKTGTSFAAPQVSAGAALIRSKNKDATTEEMRNYLETTATDITDHGYSEGWDEYTGHGLLNLEALWNSIWSRPNIFIANFKCKHNIETIVNKKSNTLYSAFVDYDSDKIHFGESDGSSMKEQKNLGEKSKYSTPMVIYDDKIYMFSTDIKTGKIYIKTHELSDKNLDNWSKRIETGLESKYKPSVTAFDNKIYLTTVDLQSNHIQVSYSDDGEKWTNIDSNIKTSFTSNIAAYKNKLYLTSKELGSNKIHLWQSRYGKEWKEPLGDTLKTESYNDVSLIEYDEKLYMSSNDKEGHIYIKYYDGSSYSNSVNTTQKSDSVASLTELNGTLYQFPVLDNVVYKRTKL